jgi:hypothetical protein
VKPPTTPREMVAHLQHELSVANNWIEHHQNHVDDLIKENAALRELTSTLGAPNHINIPVEKWRELQADKERLDWIAKNRSVSVTERPLAVTPDSLRASIDAARKEAQP